MMCAHQTQHRLKIRPVFLKRFSGHCRCLFRCLVEKLFQSFRIDETHFRIDQRSGERVTAKSRFAVCDLRISLFAARSSLDLAARLGFYLFHLAPSKHLNLLMRSLFVRQVILPASTKGQTELSASFMVLLPE